MVYQFYGCGDDVEMPHQLATWTAQVSKKEGIKFAMEEGFTPQLLEELTEMGKKYADAKHVAQEKPNGAGILS